jgi:hypothetical protein
MLIYRSRNSARFSRDLLEGQEFRRAALSGAYSDALGNAARQFRNWYDEASEDELADYQSRAAEWLKAEPRTTGSGSGEPSH